MTYIPNRDLFIIPLFLQSEIVVFFELIVRLTIQ